MKYIHATVVVILFLLASCAVPANIAVPTSPLPASTAVPTSSVKSGTIQFAHITTPSVSTLPLILVLEALRKEGYTVNETFFETQEVGVEALSRGDMDISLGAPNTYWNAIQKGANIRTVAGSLNNPFFIVARQGIDNCADLQGKRYGIGSASGPNVFLSKEYIRENCPDAVPEFLTITSSQARMAALLADGLDATTVEIADFQELERQAPGKFHKLVDFAETFPWFIFQTVFMNRDFAAEHPDMAKDFLRAVLTTQRDLLANPQPLYDAAVTHLKLSPEQARAAIDPYLASQVWKLNHRDTAESFQHTLDALVEMGALPAGMKLDDVADLTYLNQVLADSQ